MHRLIAIALTLCAIVMALAPSLTPSWAYAAEIEETAAPRAMAASDCHAGTAASAPTPPKHHGKTAGDCLSQCLAQCLAVHSGILPYASSSALAYAALPEHHALPAISGKHGALSGIDPPPPRRG